jgi:BirA family transcriptional regulator, biotin operon repressor / biotin---[acetyl-CoA-carboxylase] ligase
MQIWAHEHKVLAVSTDKPSPPLNPALISEKISRYWRVSVVEVTGSTQDDLSQSVKKDATRSGTLLIANFQSSGRGRLDRTFSAPPSSALTLSFYLTPHLDRAEWSFLPLLTGLSAISSLKNLDAGLRVSLKWPNDLLVNGRKLGGILVEATSDGVVIGIGVNVAMAQDQLPTKDATSLLLEDFACLDRNLIAVELLNVFHDLYERWQAGEDMRHLYRENCETLGMTIRVELPNAPPATGKATDISRTGELIMESGLRVSVGDIVHLR